MFPQSYSLSPSETIYKFNLGASNSYIKKCINTIYEIGDTQSNQTNVKALMTDWRIWKNNNIFNNLLDNIIRALRVNLKLDPKIFDLQITECWGSIYKEGHYSVAHTHFPSNFSFVYYLTDSPQTPIVFPQYNNFSLYPKVNDLIIFSGGLFHKVPKHKGKDRVIIAGNANVYIFHDSWIPESYTLKHR